MEPKEYKEFEDFIDNIYDFAEKHGNYNGIDKLKQFIKENFIAKSELNEIVPDKILDEYKLYQKEELKIFEILYDNKRKLAHDLNEQKIGFNKCIEEIKQKLNNLIGIK